MVSVASSAHALTGGVDLDDVAWEKRQWDSSAAYGESKLANVLFARALAQRYPPGSEGMLTSVAVHPGVVATSLFREFSPALVPQELGKPLASALDRASSTVLESPPVKLLIKKPEEGCRT